MKEPAGSRDAGTLPSGYGDLTTAIGVGSGRWGAAVEWLHLLEGRIGLAGAAETTPL